MSLTEGAGSIFHTVHHVHLRMSGSDAAPLAELLQVIKSVTACTRQYGIEHRRHVTRVEEETVTSLPARVLRVIYEKFREKHIDEIGTAHSTARVSRLSLFHHRDREYAYVICRTIELLKSIHHIDF